MCADTVQNCAKRHRPETGAAYFNYRTSRGRGRRNQSSGRAVDRGLADHPSRRCTTLSANTRTHGWVCGGYRCCVCTRWATTGLQLRHTHWPDNCVRRSGAVRPNQCVQPVPRVGARRSRNASRSCCRDERFAPSINHPKTRDHPPKFICALTRNTGSSSTTFIKCTSVCCEPSSAVS